MGPTQSAVAWGCGEETKDLQEGLTTKQGETKPQPTMPASPDCQPTDEPFPTPTQHSSTEEGEEDSHRVTLNPVYEFALCRKIKETFRRGGDASGRSSQTSEMEPMAVTETSTTASSSVVSVQPQSVSRNATDADADKRLVFHPSHPATDLGQGQTGDRGQGQTGDRGQGRTGERPGLDLSSPGGGNGPEPGRSSQGCRDDDPAVSANSPELGSDRADGARPCVVQKQPEAQLTETFPPLEHNQVTGLSPSSATTTPAPTAERHIHTDTKATQTTTTIQTHPGDISLSPPPPPTTAPLTVSVSTPPDETSPFLARISGSYLTDEVPSSPDVESDASEAGYSHLRARFGSSASQDGGAAASGAAAAAASGGSSETGGGGGEPGRRKRSKKKEEKSIEYVLRTLHHLGSPQEKLSALCKKYTDLHEEQKAVHTLLKQQQRKMSVVQREKDRVQSEHTKAVMTKSKLESLCRELQKQNKVVKDESLLRMREEEERRKQMTAKFQTSLSEIQAQVDENHEQNLQLREENGQLSRRLQAFLEQHQAREEQLDRLGQARDLELRLAQSRLQQASSVLREEQEAHLSEREKILRQATEGEKKNVILETELNKYKERYEEFQDTIQKSSQTFHRLKSDMDRMGGRIKRLEKEGEQWKSKWETCNKALQDVRQEKTQCEQEKQTLQTKVIKLESLCRALQDQLRLATKTTDTLLSSPDPGAQAVSPSYADADATTTTTTTTNTTTTTTLTANSAELCSGSDAP